MVEEEQNFLDPVGEIDTGNMHDKLLEIQNRIVDEEKRIRRFKDIADTWADNKVYFCF